MSNSKHPLRPRLGGAVALAGLITALAACGGSGRSAPSAAAAAGGAGTGGAIGSTAAAGGTGQSPPAGQAAEPGHRPTVPPGDRAVRAVSQRARRRARPFVGRRLRQRRSVAHRLGELPVEVGAQAGPLVDGRELYRFFHTGDDETFALRG